MKYKAVIETDDYKDFKFFEDGIGKYMAAKDACATSSGGWIPLYFTECRESVLDKIRTEIEKLQKMCSKDDLNLMAQHSAFGMVLDIFDKYMIESEE